MLSFGDICYNQLTNRTRCFGDKGDVEDITEGERLLRGVFRANASLLTANIYLTS
jgi:hypothetical protein